MRNLTPMQPGLCRDRSGGTDTRNPVLVRLLDERDSQLRFVDETLARVEEDGRDLVEAERNNLSAARERVRQLDEQIEPLEEFEQLRNAHRDTTARYSPTAERGAVAPGGSLGARTEPRGREFRSAGEVIVARVLAFDGNAQARDSLAAAGLRTGIPEVDRQVEQTRAVAHQVTGDTPGLLPEHIIGEIDSDTDAARPFLTSIGVRDLGVISGKTFERPTVTQHTQVGEQSAEKAELPSRKFVVSGIPFTKRTFGGSLNVSRQDIDWTSPSAWDALIRDLQEQYALETENAAADAFATAVTATTELTTAAGATPTLAELAKAFYSAASAAYGGSGRLPNHVWMSLDMWAAWGPVLDVSIAEALRASGNDSNVSQFAGQVMRLPRTVVPSLPAGTVIVGVKEKTEAYEERIGLLQAVQPSVLGVEIAYGGYLATGTIRPAAFGEIVNAV